MTRRAEIRAAVIAVLQAGMTGVRGVDASVPREWQEADLPRVQVVTMREEVVDAHFLAPARRALEVDVHCYAAGGPSTIQDRIDALAAQVVSRVPLLLGDVEMELREIVAEIDNSTAVTMGRTTVRFRAIYS